MATYTATVDALSPNRHWRLGELTGTSAVDRISSSDGTYMNSPVLGQTGALVGDSDTSVIFDGSNDYVIAPGMTDSQGTMTAWINPDVISGTQWVISAATDTTNTQFLVLVRINSSGQVTIGRQQGAVYTEVRSTNTLSAGNWYFIAVSGDGSEYKIYIDGVEETLIVANGSNDGQWISVPTTNNFTIGAGVRSTGHVAAFDGLIDEVAMFPTVLSAADILTLYDAGTTAPVVDTEVLLDPWTEVTSFQSVTVDAVTDISVLLDAWSETISFQDVTVHAMVDTDLAVDTWTEVTSFLPMDAVITNEVMMDTWTETISFQDMTISAAMGIPLDEWTETIQFNDMVVGEENGIPMDVWSISVQFNPINLTNNPGRLYTRFYDFTALTLAVGSHIEYELDAIAASFPALDDLITQSGGTNQTIIDDAVEQAETAVGQIELDEATAFAAAAAASETSAADWAELARRYAEETAGTEVQAGDYSSRHHTEMGGQAFQIEPAQSSTLTSGMNYVFPAGAANKTLLLGPSNSGDVICIAIRDTDTTTILLDGVGAVLVEGNPTFTLDQNINYIVSDEAGDWLVLRGLP